MSKQPKSFLNEIRRLKKLKKLNVTAYYSSDLKEVTLIASIIMPLLLTSSQIVRGCRQVEILRMNVICLTLGDLTELELAENITDITLCWFGELPCIKEVFPVLKGWRQLHRLTLRNHNYNINHRNLTCPPFEVLSDFIMAMKHLSYLHIVPRFYGRSNDNQLKLLRD